MRVRLREDATEKPLLAELLVSLGLEIAADDGVGESAVPDAVIHVFSGRPEAQAEDLRTLAADPDIGHLPFIVLLPAETSVPIDAVRATGCDQVLSLPVAPKELMEALVFGSRNEVPPPPQVVLLVGARRERRERIRAGLVAKGHLVIAQASLKPTIQAARRLAFDCCVLDATGDDPLLGALLDVIDRRQPRAALLVAGGQVVSPPDLAHHWVLRHLEGGSSEENLIQAVEDLLVERGETVRTMELANQIAARQRELQRVNETLRMVNRAMRDASHRLAAEGQQRDGLIGVAAHELRSPLAAMAGALEFIGTDATTVLGPSDLELLQVLRRNTQRMIQLVNGILDLSRIDAGRLVLQPKEVVPSRLAEQAISTLTGRALSKQIQVKLSVDRAEEPATMDGMRVVQMLVNLIDNALKFSPPKSQVEVRIRRRGERLHFVVNDQGPGVPEAEQAWIFERFNHRSRGSDPHSGGSGLGLTITKALAAEHGGTVTVGTSPSGGAQFTLTLPTRLTSGRPEAPLS